MAAAMATPQPILEAGLRLDYEDDGRRLIIRETDPGACKIRNRGGEMLSRAIAANRNIRALDLRESNVTDNGVGHICLSLRQTDQLEELYCSQVGHVGFEFLLGVVRRCSRLQKLHVVVTDVQTQVDSQKMISPEDYDTSNYVRARKEGEEEEEGEEEPAEPAVDEDEDEEERARKKLEKLRKIFAENDYDSEDEGHGGAAMVSAHSSKEGTSQALLHLLSDFVMEVRKKENLVEISCSGDAVPAEISLDLQRCVEEHREKLETRKHRTQERGARTAFDALHDQMAELRAGVEGGGAPAAGSSSTRLPGEPEVPDVDATRLGIRAFIGRRLFAALGEALFECQRFKSKENESVATSEGELAFIAMYLRRHMKAQKNQGQPQ